MKFTAIGIQLESSIFIAAEDRLPVITLESPDALPRGSTNKPTIQVLAVGSWEDTKIGDTFILTKESN